MVLLVLPIVTAATVPSVAYELLETPSLTPRPSPTESEPACERDLWKIRMAVNSGKRYVTL